MNFLLGLEYIINLIILLLFHMHMFQLNSYTIKKHKHWIRKNIKKISMQIGFVASATILVCLNNILTNIIAVVILTISIIYNLPKEKAKISLKITNRVKRMFVTEIVLILLIFMISGIKQYILIKLGVINVIAFILCIIANIINFPIERLGQRRYVNQAKKIIKDMPNLTVIGVTGSYGKTSVKNFLAKTLSAKYEVLVTPQNYNTTMGVVKTIRENLKPTHQIFICEMGATKQGDIKEICDIVNPKIGVITAIGPQHLESFKSIDNILKTKFELADSVRENGGKVFLNYNNEYIAKGEKNNNELTYGINNEELDYNAYDIESSSKGLSFKMIDKSSAEEIVYNTKLIGKHNVINLTVAIAVANYLDIPMRNLISRVREIKSVNHRLELISHGNLTIIDDSYNANPISSKSAIDTLAEFKGIKIVVTPGLIELGENEEKYNFELGEYMTGVCDYIFLVGEKHSKPILNGILAKNFNKERVFTVNSPQEAMKRISELNIENEITVLLENDLPDNYN